MEGPFTGLFFCPYARPILFILYHTFVKLKSNFDAAILYPA